MLNRFTVPARRAIEAAQAERRSLGHRFIGTEHLLLGLLHPETGRVADTLRGAGVDPERVRAEVERLRDPEPDGLGETDAAALRSIGIDLDAVRATVEQSFGKGALEPPPPSARRRWFGGQLRPTRLTGRARKVLELALRESLRLGHDHTGPEHILLGLLREGNGLAVRILTGCGVDLAGLRQRVIGSLDRAA